MMRRRGGRRRGNVILISQNVNIIGCDGVRNGRQERERVSSFFLKINPIFFKHTISQQSKYNRREKPDGKKEVSLSWSVPRPQIQPISRVKNPSRILKNSPDNMSFLLSREAGM
jgi:hypothetical protein